MKTATKLVLTLIRLNDNVVDIRPSPDNLADTDVEKPNPDAALKDFYNRANYF